MNHLFSLKQHRSIIRCVGQPKETSQFLQGMITNDMQLFDQGKSCIYTLFLNKLGRILYDSIIYKCPQTKSADKEEFLIECDTDVVKSLINSLKLYRVRRKVDISLSDEHALWCLSSSNELPSTDKFFVFEDPRLKAIGSRIITQDKNDLQEFLKDATTGSYNDYITHRYRLGVGEGVIDFPPEKSFPLEANCDLMNGVSFNKGCYIGQELTARTHHTGVVRKRLMPLIFDKPITLNSNDVVGVKDEQKKSIGKLRNVSENYGLALMRVEQALAAKELSINENICRTEKPTWWP